MNIIEKYKTELVVLRALHLFFYNWKQKDIDILCEDKEFKFNWDELLASQTSIFIRVDSFYKMFSTQFSFEGQAKIIEYVLKKYKSEATESVDFSIYTKEHRFTDEEKENAD
jgi:hypothetical protein